MGKEIIIGAPVESCGLGDILLLTAVCKHFPHVTVELPLHRKDYQFLFNGICQRVVFTQRPRPCPEIGGGTYIKRKLRALGYEGDDMTPFVMLTNEIIAKGQRALGYFQNPVIFNANTAPRWKHQREFSAEKWEPIIEQVAEKHTVIQVGQSDNFTPVKNTVPLLDLDLETLAGLCHVVKAYIGVDTGIHHLMLAVGGVTNVFIPQNFDNYYEEWLYNDERVKYFLMP